jgi:hypothetical protein
MELSELDRIIDTVFVIGLTLNRRNFDRSWCNARGIRARDGMVIQNWWGGGGRRQGNKTVQSEISLNSLGFA